MAYPGFPRARKYSDAKFSSLDDSPPHSPSPYTTRFGNIRGRALLLRRKLRYHFPWIAILVAVLALDTFYHTRPLLQPLTEPLDKPFSMGCQEPPVDAPRANATLLMLARNSDVKGAVAAVKSVEEKFNHWANYPIAFLNDELFNETFKSALTSASSGSVTFAQIPSHMWSIPSSLDRTVAKKAMADQGARGMPYGGQESYHHMCRFNSGFFYDIPELQRYKWYWRIEPDVRFTCSITYDPFVEMQRAGKVYGYIIALWELTPTIPSLYRKISDYKASHGFRTTRLWKALIKPVPAPWPIRKLMSYFLINRNSAGDPWNVCHFWSNFEIADMDWYRGREYRELFAFLDADGGFFTERWGDAPVHTLAAAMLLDDSQLHHFRDWGYVHPPFQYLPILPREGWGGWDGKGSGNSWFGSESAAKAKARLEMEFIDGKTREQWESRNYLAGCKCEVDVEAGGVIDPTCGNIIYEAFG